MTWHDLLFAHWRVPAADLRPLVPEGLTLDRFEGGAWLGIVPFGMARVGFRGLRWLPGLSRFLELNVRTYVVHDGKPGVWFFRLDAASPLAVRGARRTFHLPYFDAAMTMTREGLERRYVSTRTHEGAPPARFDATYGPTGPPCASAPRSLEHWLTERYCLYCGDGEGRLRRGDVDHPPWPLQPARAEIRGNTMAEAAGLALPHDPPLLHFAASIDVRAGWPVRLDG
jgi:uncharacterized protein YqjF (DUF2071 family)